jgi:hypothetical protein
VLTPVYPVGVSDSERPADVVATAQFEVALGGSFTEACEAQLGHSLTSWTQIITAEVQLEDAALSSKWRVGRVPHERASEHVFFIN